MTIPDAIPANLPLADRKRLLRRTMLAARDAAITSPEEAAAAGEAMAARALADPSLGAILTSGIVAGYWPIRSELDPRPLLQALAQRGIDVALPIVTPDGLVFRPWDMSAPLAEAGFGTLGPSCDVEDVSPAVLLVPLAAVDYAGNRLGYGRGYYDAAIARLSTSESARHSPAMKMPFAIGVCHDMQLIPSVPAEPHDRPLDAIVTPMQSIVVETGMPHGPTGTSTGGK